MKIRALLSTLMFIFLFLTFMSMYFISPTKVEVDTYFENNKCTHCSGDVYGAVYQMRRETGKIWGQVINIPWFLPKFLFYGSTPFHYYHDINHRLEEFNTYTWVDTKDGRFVYNAITGAYVKEIDDKKDPALVYHEKQKAYAQKMMTLQENAECSYNAYDCIDFETQAEAQAVLFSCKSQGSGDIHHLDGDNDNKACENLR